jgi:hypothetical protein
MRGCLSFAMGVTEAVIDRVAKWDLAAAGQASA